MLLSSFSLSCFMQIPSVDYTDTFAPIIKATSTRVLFTITSANGLLIFHFDVETAFLNPSIEEELYIEQPVGFEVLSFEDHIFMLDKALYSLKQSAVLW